MRPRVVAVALTLCALASGNARAQAADPAPRAHHIAVSGGLLWAGGYALGGNTATLRRNETGTSTPGPFALFTADASMRRAVGVESRVGYAITPSVSLELHGALSKPRLAVSIAQDAESEAVVLDGQRVSQYMVGGSAVWQLSRLELGRRGRPYLIGGAGYLRQLDADRAHAETGRTLHAGGGVRYWLHGGDQARRAFGVRGEFRMELRSGGLDVSGKRRAFPAASFMGFFGL